MPKKRKVGYRTLRRECPWVQPGCRVEYLPKKRSKKKKAGSKRVCFNGVVCSLRAGFGRDNVRISYWKGICKQMFHDATAAECIALVKSRQLRQSNVVFPQWIHVNAPVWVVANSHATDTRAADRSAQHSADVRDKRRVQLTAIGNIASVSEWKLMTVAHYIDGSQLTVCCNAATGSRPLAAIISAKGQGSVRVLESSLRQQFGAIVIEPYSIYFDTYVSKYMKSRLIYGVVHCSYYYEIIKDAYEDLGAAMPLPFELMYFVLDFIGLCALNLSPKTAATQMQATDAPKCLRPPECAGIGLFGFYKNAADDYITPSLTSLSVVFALNGERHRRTQMPPLFGVELDICLPAIGSKSKRFRNGLVWAELYELSLLESEPGYVHRNSKAPYRKWKLVSMQTARGHSESESLAESGSDFAQLFLLNKEMDALTTVNLQSYDEELRSDVFYALCVYSEMDIYLWRTKPSLPCYFFRELTAIRGSVFHFASIGNWFAQKNKSFFRGRIDTPGIRLLHA